MASTSKRVGIAVAGIVQGVGFRPFVYQLAQRFSLAGFVRNDVDGVVIEIEGEESAVKGFLVALEREAPPLARVDTLQTEPLSPTDEEGFTIRRSEGGSATAMVSPDIAICDACLAEMHDIDDRRYRYPFINCTDCGPRYSIIRALPYDRPFTSMAPFTMCLACAAEYADPMNRRYHAQPLSCDDCGPKITLRLLDGRVCNEDITAINCSCDLLLEGKTVALKGLGGFHLLCDATNEAAVARLREKKHRPTKPLAVMFKDMASLKAAAEVTEADERLLLSKERPIVIVNKKEGSPLSDAIAPGIAKVGVFLAYTPLHIVLLEKLNRPVVATSANISDAPIITSEEELLAKLDRVVQAVLSYDREIVNACDDSVTMMAGEEKLTLRMARGYAPKSLPLKLPAPRCILAVGANQKSTIALAFGDHMILSPHIGDLVSLEAFAYFERTVETFRRLYDFAPELIVCDKHPGYESARWARSQCESGTPALLEVQHHYAHALACMAEYGLNEKVLAFCFDGTGYGDDGTLWGGEVLVADPQRYERAEHFRPFRLIGGEKAVREPRRVALALLFDTFTFEEIAAMENPTVSSFTKAELQTLHKMWERGINAPLSSSAGRLFDAVASFGGIAQTLNYEGESGLLLEKAAAKSGDTGLFSYLRGEEGIDFRPMVREILDCDAPEAIASRFIATLSALIVETARRYPALPVVLSGGVFQNATLVQQVSRALKREKREYYIQHNTPVNDGGIALGQLYHALHTTGR